MLPLKLAQLTHVHLARVTRDILELFFVSHLRIVVIVVLVWTATSLRLPIRRLVNLGAAVNLSASLLHSTRLLSKLLLSTIEFDGRLFLLVLITHSLLILPLHLP